MKHPSKLKRGHVRDEITSILRAGRQRIIALGGTCDPLKRMVKDSMHVLDYRADEEERHNR